MKTPNWDAVTNWDASCVDIAAQAGTYRSRASAEKRLRGGAMWKHTKPRAVGSVWDDVDWGTPDMELVKQLGASRQCVNQARKRYTNTYCKRGAVYFEDGTPWEALVIPHAPRQSHIERLGIQVIQEPTPHCPTNQLSMVLVREGIDQKFSQYFGIQTSCVDGLYPHDVEAVLVRIYDNKLTGTQLHWD